VERESFGQFAFDILKLFPMDTKRQNSTRNSIDGSHALENQAVDHVWVPSAAALRWHRYALPGSLLS
jgi:hypothetical protein